MLFLPAKVVEGLLVIGCSSLYSHIFVEGAVSAFNLTNTTIQLLYLILAGWMANSATRYVGEEYRADEGRGLFSTVSTIYVGLCVLVAIGCCITAAVTQSPVYLGGALMFCTYTAFQVLNAALIQLGRVKASILWSLTSAVLKLAVAFALVGGKSNYPSPFPAIFANTIADGVAAIGAVFALSLPVVVRLKYFSKPLLNRFLKYGVPLMGVSISVALLNQIDKYLVVGFYGNILYAYYSNNNSIASGLFTMISVGIMRGVYPAVLRGWREGGKAAAKPLLDQGVRLYLLIAVPAVAGLTAVALPLSRFLFPAKYAAGAPVIAYTALAMLFMGLTEYANKAYELEQPTVHVLHKYTARSQQLSRWFRVSFCSKPSDLRAVRSVRWSHLRPTLSLPVCACAADSCSVWHRSIWCASSFRRCCAARRPLRARCCQSAISFALARLSWSVQAFMRCVLSSAVRAARKYRRCSAG